jgi:hypothetical protein
MTPNTDRMNAVAKRHIDQMLRQCARGETLRLAWRALFETVRGEQQVKERQNA